jgi:hypothetical protein
MAYISHHRPDESPTFFRKRVYVTLYTIAVAYHRCQAHQSGGSAFYFELDTYGATYTLLVLLRYYDPNGTW